MGIVKAVMFPIMSEKKKTPLHHSGLCVRMTKKGPLFSKNHTTRTLKAKIFYRITARHLVKAMPMGKRGMVVAASCCWGEPLQRQL